MLIIPAIDIKNGKCVRLTQGDFSREVIYEDNPLLMAKRFEHDGANMLHIVDLDGAKEGKLMNSKVIGRIANTVNIPVQVGGGIRDEKAIKLLLSLGVTNVILGTIALGNKAVLKSLLKRFADKITISLDSKNGKLVKNGWQKETEVNCIVTARELQALGVKRFIYTDTLKDGTLTMPNFKEIEYLLQNISVPVVVGGGISSIDDIKKLSVDKVEGVIIGKAFYENKFTLREVQNVS